MHQTIDYSGIDDSFARALADCRDWLGPVFDKIEPDFKQLAPMEWNDFWPMFMMAGIQGFPLRALYHHYWGFDPYDDVEMISRGLKVIPPK